MSSTIWALSSGSYSDYGVRAIFTTEEKAEAARKEYSRLLFHSDAFVEEFELDPEIVVMPIMLVQMERDGRVTTLRSLGNDEVTATGFFSYPDKFTMSWHVATDDEGRAVKVVNEKRAMLIAAGVWGDTKATRALLAKGE